MANMETRKRQKTQHNDTTVHILDIDKPLAPSAGLVSTSEPLWTPMFDVSQFAPRTSTLSVSTQNPSQDATQPESPQRHATYVSVPPVPPVASHGVARGSPTASPRLVGDRAVCTAASAMVKPTTNPPQATPCTPGVNHSETSQMTSIPTSLQLDTTATMPASPPALPFPPPPPPHSPVAPQIERRVEREHTDQPTQPCSPYRDLKVQLDQIIDPKLHELWHVCLCIDVRTFVDVL